MALAAPTVLPLLSLGRLLASPALKLATLSTKMENALRCVETASESPLSISAMMATLLMEMVALSLALSNLATLAQEAPPLLLTSVMLSLLSPSSPFTSTLLTTKCS